MNKKGIILTVSPMGKLIALILATGLLGACADELEKDVDRQRTAISFDVSTRQGAWQAAGSVRTKATDRLSEDKEMNAVAMQGKVDGKQMFLHAVTTDTISPGALGNKQGGQKTMTRATPIQKEQFHEAFGAFAYVWTANTEKERISSYMDNVKVNVSGSTGTPAEPLFWPGKAYNLRMYGYAPYVTEADGNGITIQANESGIATIAYDVPYKSAEQPDLLVAKSGDLAGNLNTAVSLRFSHALTAVQVKTEGDCPEGTITSVRLKNVCTKGTYSFESETWNLDESPNSENNNFEVRFEPGKTVEGATDVVTGENTFMMLPQDLDGVQLEVVFVSGGSEQTLVADLQGEWAVGQMKVYSLSLSGNAEKGE